MAKPLVFVATCALGLEDLLVTELRRMGLQRVHAERGAVRFHGAVKDGYKATLWSRLASRVLWRMGRFECLDSDSLYAGIYAMPWADHVRVDRTMAVRFAGTSKQLRDERFSARRVKDAVCDRLREDVGGRPDVDPKDPDLRLMVRLRDGTATVHLDLSGPLHERGGGRTAGKAPLRETLAAAMLHWADWPKNSRQGLTLLDPMCGSGTILTEAAGIATRLAPGLAKERWVHQGWAAHDASIWDRLTREAREQIQPLGNTLVGRDRDKQVLALARRNAASLGFEQIRFEHGDARSVNPPGEGAGLIVTNPPYGERLDQESEVAALFDAFGASLKANMSGWTVWLMAGPNEAIKEIGMKSSRRIAVRNGQLRCSVCAYEVR